MYSSTSPAQNLKKSTRYISIIMGFFHVFYDVNDYNYYNYFYYLLNKSSILIITCQIELFFHDQRL